MGNKTQLQANNKSLSEIYVTMSESATGHINDKNNPHGVTPYKIGAASNPNLLDNWYFADPINQRGNTQYTGIGYTIDRWHSDISQSTVTIHSGYITIYKKSSGGYFNQSIEMDLRGKQVTCSVLFRNGELYHNSFVLTEDNAVFSRTIGDAYIYGNFETSKNKTVFGFYFNSSDETTLDIVATKMELGSQQTLARQENGVWVLNEIPNYAEQMAICSQYDSTTGEYLGVVAHGHSHSASEITSGTFAATGVKAASGTDYTTHRIRNIAFGNTDLTAGSSALTSGNIYLVYE